MGYDKEAFRKEIEELLELGYEGSYWDYKSDYTPKVEDKLLDIICMANNLENRDAYIIYGVNDDGTVRGIEKPVSDDPAEEQKEAKPRVRITSKNITEFLREKPFAGGYYPLVEVRVLQFGEHEVDVLVVKKSDHMPFFLSAEFNPCKDPKYKLHAGAIYTRTVDINTPRNKTASIESAEKLWRKRFGYDMQPSKRFEVLLGNYEGWSETNWEKNAWRYCLDYPEYQIKTGEHEEGYETLKYFYHNPAMYYAPMTLNYLNTTLYETEIWYMDGGGIAIPKPEQKVFEREGYHYYYFLKNTMQGKLLGLFTNGEFTCKLRTNLQAPVLIFENEAEQRDFECLLAKRDIVEPIEQKIKDDEIYKKVRQEEESAGDGDRIYGTLGVAIAYEVYLEWKKDRESVDTPLTGNNYKVITLCGSTRFKEQFIEKQKQLTLAGYIVISVGLFGHSGDQEVWDGMDEGTASRTKIMLDDMHKRKIDMADAIYVINVGGYIGESTKSEIEYAKRNYKGVYYLESPQENVE